MARDDVKTARLFDRRTVERNIKKGLITRKDYEKHLKALEDTADKGVYGGTDTDEPDEDDLDDIAADAGDAGSNGRES
jgi:nitrogen regulatory protein PII-like uncharacterized protein